MNDAHARPVLITGGHIVNLTNSVGRIEDVDILVENERIARIAPHGLSLSSDVQRLDATGCLIVPGLTNAHTHSPENLAAGFCDRLHLDNWLNAVWGRLDHLSSREIQVAVLDGVAQMLKSGVTAVVDHFRQTPMSLDALDSACAAYRSTGIRVILPVMLRDRVSVDGQLIGAPTGGSPLSPQEIRNLWTDVAKRHDPQSRLALGVGPSGPTRCTDAMLETAVELSRQYSLYLHTHVAETRSEAETAQRIYGCRMVKHLDEIGFLGPRTSLAHCVWIDDGEIELIARASAVIVHNPVSNLALGSGIAPVPCMVQAKALVALGTDGAASNGAQDIWESVKCAALASRCSTADTAAWITAHQALMFSIGGGRELFGLGPPVIAEQAVADIAVFPVPEGTLDEFFDPVRALVYGAQARARHVLVGGNPVLVDGTITSFDEQALEAELRRIRKRTRPSDRDSGDF
jgi:cytosine/adenosine deaminase-related metal-dependent hydrolase